MRISGKGIEKLIELEGSKAHTYLDSAGLPTIGVGHLLTKDELSSGKINIGLEQVKYKDGLTQGQITHLLRQDLAGFENEVENSIIVKLEQHQFDALVFFCFNIGRGAFRSSTLRKLLNKGDYESVPEQMRRWVYAGKVKVAGLANRREKTIQVWLNGYPDWIPNKQEEQPVYKTLEDLIKHQQLTIQCENKKGRSGQIYYTDVWFWKPDGMK